MWWGRLAGQCQRSLGVLACEGWRAVQRPQGVDSKSEYRHKVIQFYFGEWVIGLNVNVHARRLVVKLQKAIANGDFYRASLNHPLAHAEQARVLLEVRLERIPDCKPVLAGYIEHDCAEMVVQSHPGKTTMS